MRCSLRIAVHGFPWQGSTLLVRMENVVLRFHGHVARLSAVLKRGIWCELVRWSVIVEHGVSPSPGLRESLAVLLHYESLLKHIGNTHCKGRFRALFLRPL